MTERPRAGGLAELFRRNAIWLVVLLAIAASITGLRNGFALDDIEVIVNNPRLHTLADPWGLLRATYWRAELGATLYRPMTMAAFALEWVLGDGSPLPFHLTSVALYAALSAAVYRLAKMLMPLGAAFAAASLFAVHPVHVEAVANVVGQSELWVALILVMLVSWYIELPRDGPLPYRQVVLLSAGYFIACCFKEHAIVLPTLLLAAELLLVGDVAPVRVRLRNLIPLVIGMTIAGLAFVLARYWVLHGVMLDSRPLILRNQPFTARFFTMLGVVVEWIRLFFWPMSLSADYSFPRIRMHSGFELQMLPAVMVLAGISTIGLYIRKQSPVMTFGIVWIVLAMLIPSNLLIVTGFVLAERTLMLATVGLALCAGLAVNGLLGAGKAAGGRLRSLALPLFGILLVTFAGRSITRGPAWHDNRTLILQTVHDVPSSFRAHWMFADELADARRMPQALDEMDLAVALGEPNDLLLLTVGGDMFASGGRCPRALSLYRRALAIGPNNVHVRASAAWCLINIGKLVEAKTMALSAPEISGDSTLQRLAGAADSLQLVRSSNIASR